MKMTNIFKVIKDNLYLLIPFTCLLLWTIYYLFNISFTAHTHDFLTLYNAGKRVFSDPSNLYMPGYSGYLYLPVFALFFSISFSLLPYDVAYFSFFTLSIFMGILSILELNKILILKGIKKKIHRLIFLVFIPNGFILFHNFYFNQTKLIVLWFFLFLIRREIEAAKNIIDKDLKFYIIHFNLFLFILSIVPYLAFLFLIYIFQEISLKTIFKSPNLKKYLVITVSFFLQNFLFIIFPNLIFLFLYGTSFASRQCGGTTCAIPLFVLNELIQVTLQEILLISTIMVILTIILTLILILNKKLRIDQKFSLFFLVYVFIDTYKGYPLLIIIIPFILLLFVPYFNQDARKLNFIKKNFIWLLGMLALFSLNIIFTDINDFYKYLPFIDKNILSILLPFRWIAVFTIVISALIILEIKNRKSRLDTNSNKMHSTIPN